MKLVAILLGVTMVVVVDCVELKPNCGYPGKPYRATITPDEKLVFSEGDTVSYQCADFWAPPQSKKCVKGRWEGPLVRCGEFVHDLLMLDSRAMDVSTVPAAQVFHHTKMNITSTDWTRPNSFTSNRFRKARLRIETNHTHLWTFNFTRPAVKLFAKIHFNVLNFTLMSDEFKRDFKFELHIKLSQHRTCKLEHVSHILSWRADGDKIESFFVCEANTLSSLQADIADPPNLLEMTTKASHSIAYELVGVFFGHVYGTESEPLCGLPELQFGEIHRVNMQHRDYFIECLNRHEWQDHNPANVRKFVYVNRCIGDMRWNGTRPYCKPKLECALTNTNSNYQTGLSNGSHHENLVIDSICKVYYDDQTDTIHATPGAEIVYVCSSDDYVLSGKDTRVCRDNMQWSGSEPVCTLLQSRTTFYLLPVYMSAALVVALLVTCCLGCVFIWRQKQRRQQKACQQSPRMSAMYDQAMYDNIELSLEDKDDGLYEIYERIDGSQATTDRAGHKLLNEEIRYTQHIGYYNDEQDSYVQMVQHRAARPTISNDSGQVTITSLEPQNTRMRQPSYLELNRY